MSQYSTIDNAHLTVHNAKQLAKHNNSTFLWIKLDKLRSGTHNSKPQINQIQYSLPRSHDVNSILSSNGKKKESA